ncbi:hypothetical protein K440DRAFT_634529 [Wilcoxina mikolae CBS 423.85]|nr:hypothetical protein K440DRAFT_634529 [Wilcoxina mikolae CBS 423.85]
MDGDGAWFTNPTQSNPIQSNPTTLCPSKVPLYAVALLLHIVSPSTPIGAAQRNVLVQQQQVREPSHRSFGWFQVKVSRPDCVKAASSFITQITFSLGLSRLFCRAGVRAVLLTKAAHPGPPPIPHWQLAIGIIITTTTHPLILQPTVARLPLISSSAA